MTDSQSPNAGSPRQPINPAGTSTPPPPPGYVPAVYVQSPGGKSGMSKVGTYLLGLLLLGSITANVYLYLSVQIFSLILLEQGPREIAYLEGDSILPEERIVVVEVEGAIDTETANYMHQAFDKLGEDVPAAVILRVNSGGGSVSASDQIWHDVMDFRAENPDVPVIASFGGVAASGAYYISAPADYIFCERTGMTGSIGVIAQIPSMAGLIEKIGVEMNTIIADGSPNKADANDLFVAWYDEDGDLTEEGEAGMEVVKNLLDQSYNTFFDVVLQGRSQSPAQATEEDMRQVATGAIFIGEQALDAKLVDEIGYLSNAITHAATQASITGAPTVKIMRPAEPGPLSAITGSTGLINIDTEEIRNMANDFSDIKLQYRMRLR